MEECNQTVNKIDANSRERVKRELKNNIRGKKYLHSQLLVTRADTRVPSCRRLLVLSLPRGEERAHPTRPQRLVEASDGLGTIGTVQTRFAQGPNSSHCPKAVVSKVGGGRWISGVANSWYLDLEIYGCNTY